MLLPARGAPASREQAAETPARDALPEDWDGRLDKLPSATLVHVPAQFRERLAASMSDGLEDLLAGGRLERGRSKLLLAPPPPSVHRRSELSTRFRLWGERRFEQLLTRVEEQARDREAFAQRGEKGSAGARARKLVREGAYRKGATALSGGVATLSPAEQARWASELLPRAAVTEQQHAAVAVVAAAPAPAETTAAIATAGEPSEDPEARDDIGIEGWHKGAGSHKLRQAALGGVRFPALSAAGPSGARPEHLNEALLARRRSVTARLLRAIARVVRCARQGGLPDEAAWLGDSRLAYLSKPGTDTPRPIRVGELWRRVVAKRAASDVRDEAQKLLASKRQGGVALPGGADALVLLRRQLEAVAGIGDEAVAILDLDLRNAFPSFEWPAIRAAVGKWMPQLSDWTAWCHQKPGRIQLPCGEWTECDRGAEQGDPLGPLYCALVLLDCAEEGRAAVEAFGSWSWDAWYMDDGQIVLPPAAAQVFVRAFDAALTRVGGTRISGDGKFKSTAKLLGSVPAVAAVPADWCDELRETCRILDPSPGGVVLGISITGADANVQAATIREQVRVMCERLPQLDDPAAELALVRASFNACRVTHLLRGAGLDLDPDLLEPFDELTEQALGSILGGCVSGTSWAQATSGAKDGGLGLRSAAEARLPAALACAAEARPLARNLSMGLPEELRGPLFSRWDSQFERAVGAWTAELPASSRGLAHQLLEDGRAEAEARTLGFLGLIPCHRGEARPSPGAAAASAIISPIGSEDPEHPDEMPNLQTQLCELVSRHRVTQLRQELELAGDWAGTRRIDDLRDGGTDHSWIWAAASQSPGCRISGREFCTALLLRLGAPVLKEAGVCAVCGEVMGAQCLHALRCAPGESTRGHNGVRDQLLGLATLGDPCSVCEPPGLVPSRPGLRPADILSSAAFARQAALDVGVASPDAAGAGDDACAALVWENGQVQGGTGRAPG